MTRVYAFIGNSTTIFVLLVHFLRLTIPITQFDTKFFEVWLVRFP